MNQKTGINSFSSFSVLIVFLLLATIGGLIMPFLSIQLFPSQTHASLTITTQLPGASVEVTESSLTSPIESVVSRLPGMVNLSSNTGAGFSMVRVELDKFTDSEIFRFEVATLLRQLYPKLPARTIFPSIQLNRPDESKGTQAILGYVVYGPGSKTDITSVVERHIRPVIADIAGVYRFDVFGDLPGELAIYTDPRRMRAANITMEGLQQELRKALQNRDLGTGRFVDGKYAIFLKTAVEDVEHLKQIAVSNQEGRIFRLEDLAVVTVSRPPVYSYHRINGQDLVNMTFWSEENVNTIRLAETIKDKLKAIRRSLPDGYTLDMQFDSTSHIKEELSKIFLRTGLSVSILLLFVVFITRSQGYTIIVIASLMANIALSLILYFILGIDIHLYSLAGITIAMGLVIDNVIVIVEDIRHTGRNRIFAAILASTLTAFGALSVVFFLDESQRLHLIDFALAIIINLLVSLPIAYFLIPALLEQLPVKIRQATTIYRRKKRSVRFTTFYRRQLHLMLRFRWLLAIVFVLSFGLPFFLLPNKMDREKGWWSKWYNASIGSDFYNQNLRKHVNTYFGGVLYFYIANKNSRPNFGSGDADKQTQLYVNIAMPNGASLKQMDEICRDFDRVISAYRTYIETFTTDVASGTHAQIRILFKKTATSGNAHRLKNVLEREAVLSGAADFSVHGIGRGFSNVLNTDRFDSAIQLKGYNYQQLQDIALIVRDSLLDYKRVNGVLISSQREYGGNSTFEHVVRFTAPDYLTLRSVARWKISNTLMQGTESAHSIGRLADSSGIPIDVKIYHRREQMPDVWSVIHQPLQVNDSTSIRLSGITQRDKVRVGSSMVRENQEYVLYVNYRFIGTYQLNQIVNDRIVKAISPILPYGYKIKKAEYGVWGEDEFNYLWFIPLVLGIIYMICAILLESLTQPIAVILMIPFSFIGVFLVFYFLGLPFDQGGYAALLMLSGIVTNAALYIINDYNYFKHQDNGRKGTIARYIRAFNAKAMPIMVTTVAALLSLLPFMIAGEDKGFWFTLSAGTIGGLLFSLIGVYLVLPLCMLKKERRKRVNR